MSDEFTPTTEQVRHGYAVDPEAEYRDPLTNHTAWGERAFDRWLVQHDQAIRAGLTEQQVIDWFMSGSSSRIRRVIESGQAIMDERWADGVFE